MDRPSDDELIEAGPKRYAATELQKEKSEIGGVSS